MEKELQEQKIRQTLEEYDKDVNAMSQNRCFETIRRINAFLVAVAILVFVLILVAWPTWKNAIIFGSPVVYLFIIQIPVSALNDMYAAEVLVIFSVAYLGMLMAFIVLDFFDFIKVFSILMDTGNIGPVCSKPYCNGWQSYVFFAYYIFLLINVMLVIGVTMMLIRLFYLDQKVKKDSTRRAVNYAFNDFVKSQMRKFGTSDDNANNNEQKIK